MAKAEKKKYPVEEFLPLYLKAAEEGLTKEEFAEQLGIKPATVYQRVYELRKDHDPTIPLLPTKGRRSMKDRVAQILSQHRSPEEKARPAPKSKPKKEEPEATEVSSEEQTLDEIFG